MLDGMGWDWTGSLNHLTIRAPQGGANKSKLVCFDVEFWWTEMTLTAVVTVGALFDLEIV